LNSKDSHIAFYRHSRVFLALGLSIPNLICKDENRHYSKAYKNHNPNDCVGSSYFFNWFFKRTPFEHLSILLFLLLAGFGIHLFYITKNSAINSSTTFFLLLTSASTILFILLIEVAIVKMVLMNFSLSDGLESLEGFF